MLLEYAHTTINSVFIAPAGLLLQSFPHHSQHSLDLHRNYLHRNYPANCNRRVYVNEVS
jgi:hypothetical protein